VVLFLTFTTYNKKTFSNLLTKKKKKQAVAEPSFLDEQKKNGRCDEFLLEFNFSSKNKAKKKQY